MLYSLAQDQSTALKNLEMEREEVGPSQLKKRKIKRGPKIVELSVRIGHSLRKYLLKRPCVLNIINILLSATISLMTRDIFVKFPTILLKEMYNALGIDISDNQRTNFLFLKHEILYQRVFKPT
jgi:hypothetical protein